MDKKQIHNHPDFDAQSPKYQLWGDLCEGGDRIEANESYLPQHAYESAPQYAIRRRLATYKNHAKPIVSVFSSSVWRKEPTRELPEKVEQYSEDVDKLGSTANGFFKEIDKKAAGVGLHFVFVDQVKVEKGERNETAADSKRLGIRPYFVSVPASSVRGWGFDANGLAFVAIDESETIVNSPFEKSELKRRWRILYRNSWETLEENEKGDLVTTDDGMHPCGEVPIVPFYFRKVREMVGESSIADVSSILLRAYSLENALDKSLFDTAFPQQGFFGFEKEQIDNYIKSSSNGLVGDIDARSEFIEPSGSSFDALDKKIRNDELAIREIALRMVRPDSKVGESADAKRIDRQQLTSQLSTFSQNCQQAEKRCWELMLKWMNESGDVTVEYNRDFDINEITGDLLRAFSEMRRNRDLSRETLWQIWQGLELPLPEDFNAEDETARINAEQGSFGDFGAMGSKLLTGTT